MCFKSRKPLNPSAQEWRPTHHLRILSQAPPQAATAAAPPPHKLLWHIPYCHPFPVHHSLFPYVPLSWSHTVHFTAPSDFPASVRSNEAAALGEVKKKRPIVDGRKCASGMWRLRSAAPPARLQWRPRVIDGGASPPPVAPPLEKASSPLRRTTVMIRNIPNQLRRDFMLEFIDRYCSEYSLQYDFMYLPMDFIKGDNLGYAFVNFTSEENAMKFKGALHNYKWGDVKTEEGYLYTSKKICAVTWARIQGCERLMKRFEESVFACENLSFLPVVFAPPRGQGGAKTAPVTVGRLKSSS